MKPTRYSYIAFAVICVLVVLTPLARGSVHQWAVTLMQAGVFVALFCLALESLVTKQPLLGALPLFPVVIPILLLLILSAVSALLSRHPAMAGQGVLLLVTYVAAFVVVHVGVRTRRQARVLVYVIVGTALFLAVFGLFKRFGLNPFTFWQYDDLRYSPTMMASTYGNHNHLAGFLEMALPFLLALFLTRSRRLGTVFVMIYLVLLLLTVQALTLSRGGWVATVVSVAFMMAVLMSQRRFQSKKLLGILAGVVIGVTAFALASTPIVERVMTLSQKDDSASMESRIRAWAGTVAMIKDHWVLGTGPGTYAAAFTRYQPAGLGITFRRAHNDYLHLVADLGVLVIPLMIWLIGAFFITGFRKISHPSRQTRAFSLAAMAAVTAILVHSIGDFNLHIPANALVFSVILGSGFPCCRY